MMKKLLLLVTLISTSYSFTQTVTIDSAPASLQQGEVFNMTASFDAGAGDSIDGNLVFILRLYDTSDESFAWVAAANSNQDGINNATGVVSPNITVPPAATTSANLAVGFEYRLVASYKRTVAGNFISTAQVVTITEALVPTISYSSLPTIITSEGAPNGAGYGYGDLPYEVTWSNVPVTAPATKIFNQLRDANGVQVAGTSFDVTTTNGSMILSWGYFGGGLLVAGTQAGVFSQLQGGAANPITAKINVVETLGSKDFEMNKVSVYPNPTRDFISISTRAVYKSVAIYDITGKTVKAFGNTNTLDVSELSNGMYFLKTDTDLQAKFVKQ